MLIKVLQRTGIDPGLISRTIRLLVDGEIVSDFRYQGEKVEIRLKTDNEVQQIDQILDFRLPAKDGQLVSLRQRVIPEFTTSPNNIRHYNFRRNITIEADIDKTITDTVLANNLIKAHWQEIQFQYTNIDLDFSGILDDIEESISAIGLLFLLGLGLIYLILSTQFQNYFQPLLIIMTVPMAATGVIFGLLISRYPLSLFTLYGALP